MAMYDILEWNNGGHSRIEGRYFSDYKKVYFFVVNKEKYPPEVNA